MRKVNKVHPIVTYVPIVVKKMIFSAKTCLPAGRFAENLRETFFLIFF
jgi:hypothetical protein